MIFKDESIQPEMMHVIVQMFTQMVILSCNYDYTGGLSELGDEDGGETGAIASFINDGVHFKELVLLLRDLI